MVLENMLSQKRVAVLERWLQLILETYPAGTSRFLKQEKDRFVNPVGYTISQGIEVLYEGLLQGMNSNKLIDCLDNIIRIRSVQDFPPSQVIAFIFLLKKAIRDELASEIRRNRVLVDLLEFESKIDKLALLALDIYTKCRQKVYEIRINEVKTERERVLKLLERTNQMYSKSETEQDTKNGEI